MATETGREVCDAKECNTNSWIPGRQCVLARLPSGIGHEQFHSSFYEALSKLQDCKDKPVKEKAALLVVIWKSLGACASSLNEVSNVFQFLFSETSLVILSREWADVNPVLKERLQTVIKECSQSLCQLVDEAARLCGVLTMALHDPWGESLLRELLTSPEGSLVSFDNNCFTKDGIQPEGLLLKRIEQLSAVGCEDAALQLCKICLQCHQNSCETRSFVNASYGPETSEQEIEGTFIDWLLRLLHRTGRLAELVRETMKYTCHDGVRLIRRVQQSNEPDSLDLAEVLTHAFLVGDFLQTSTYCCTKELMVLWCDIQVEKDRELEEVFKAVKMLLVCYAATSAHFYLFVDILWEKYGPSLFPLYIEMYVRGLTSDLNYLEAISIKGSTDEVKELQVHISSVYNKFGTLFASRWPVVAYECVLSSFSLDPTDDKISVLYNLHKSIYGEQEDTEINDILHLARSSGGNVTSVSQIECKCGGRCSTPSEEPEILASLYHDGRPPYIYNYSHPILDTHIPGVSFSLLKDLVMVLECLRCQLLKANKCWKEVESLCKSYIANNCKLNVAMQYSSSLGKETDLVSDHRVCLPAVMETCYLNRTKENYYCYTQNEVNTPLSCASSFPSDVSRTLFIQKSISSSMNKTLYSVTTVPSSISTVFPSAINPYNTNLSIPCEKNTPIMNLSFPLENDISTRINANSLNLNVMSPNNRTSLFADSLSPVANIISPCTNNVSSDMNISLNRASSVSFSINTVPLHAKNIFQAIDTTLPSGSNESSVDMKSSCTVTPCTETFVPSTHTMSSTISTPIHEKTSLSCQNNLSPSVNTILPFSCESTVSSISGTAVCYTSSTFTVNNVENELVSTTVAETTEDSVCGFGKEQESENVKRRKTLSECEKESHYLSEVPSVTGDSFKTGLMPSEVILPRVEVTTAESVKPTDTQTVKVVLSRLDLGSVKSIYIPKVVDNFEKTSTSKVKSVVKKPVVVLSDILSPKFLSDPNTTHFVQQALMKHHGIEAKRKSSDVDTGQSTKKLKVTVVKLMTPEDRESEKFVSKSFRKDFQSTRDNSLGPFVSTCSVYGDKMSVHSKKEASCSPVSPMNLEFSSLESKPCVAQGKSHETGQSEVSIGVSSPGENSSIIQCKKINDLSLSNLKTVSPSMKNSVNLLYGTVNSSLQREKELVQSHMHDVDKKASDHRGRIKKTNSNLPQIVETHSTSNDTCTINSIAQEESSDESQRLNIREANESAQNISVEDAASGVQLQRSHNCSISFISSFEKFIQIEEERRKTLDCEKPLEPSVSLSKDYLDTDNTKRKSLVCKESFQISSSMDQEISQINCEKNENINSAKSSENCLSSVELKKSNMIVKESDKAKQCSHPSGNEMKCSILDESASLQFATSCSTDDKSENSSSLLSSFYDKQVKNTSPSYSYGNFNSSNSVNIIPEEFTSKLTDNFESSPDGKGIEKMDIRGTKATSWTSMSSDSEMRNFMDETIGLQRDEAINVDKNNIFNVMICSSSTETMSSASLPELHDCGNSIPDSSASKVRLLVKKCTSQQKSSLKEDKQLIGDSGSECVAHLSPLYSLTLNDKLYSRALYSNVMLGHERDKAIKNSKIEVKSTLVSEGNICTTSFNTPALEEEDCKMEMLLSNKTTAPVLSVVTSEERSSIMMRKIHRIPVFLTNRPFVGTAKKEVLEVSKGSDCNSYLTKPIIETATCSAFPSVGESKMFETRSIKPEHQKDRTEASDGEIRFGAKLVNRGGKEIAGKLIIPVSNISNPALKTLLFSTTIKSGVLKNYSSLGDSKTNTAVSVMNSKPLMSVCTEKKGREENTTQNMKTSMHVMKVQNTPVINSLPFQSMNSDSPINVILKDGDFNQLGKITPGKSISIPSVEGVQGKLDIFCNATMKTVNSVSVDGSLDTVNFSCKVSRGTVNPSPFIQAIPEAVNFEIFVEDESETASAFSDSELIAGRISSTFTGKMASKTIDLVPLETVSSRQSVKDSLKTRSTSSSKVTSEMLNYIPSVKVTSETVNSTPSNPVTPKTVNFTPSVKMQRTESSTSNVQVTPGTLNFTPIRVTTRTVNFTPSTLMTNIKVNSTCSVKATTKTVNSISSVQVTPGILNSTSSIPVTPGTVISTPLVQVKKIIGSPVSADHITPGTKNFTPIVCVAPGSVNSTSFTQMTPRTLNSTSSFRIQDTSEIVNSASVDVTSETLNSTPSIQVIPGTINSTSPIHVTSESVDYIPLVQMKRTLGSLIPTGI
ncbi:uncharacterized protein LOC106460170 [Limulus polyphemus]|uniref:Uncharacterized protein LOC106460170 n=1 Tax=Limulus polyphemus TaxID=6850 RepID=A0ABM1B5M4_LIMPO|nr:uncharacterized protein LOC106460170 [Limulus polyphemus]